MNIIRILSKSQISLWGGVCELTNDMKSLEKSIRMRMALFHLYIIYTGVLSALVDRDTLTCICVFLWEDILWGTQKHKHEHLSLCVVNFCSPLYWEFWDIMFIFQAKFIPLSNRILEVISSTKLYTVSITYHFSSLYALHCSKYLVSLSVQFNDINIFNCCK